MSGPICYVPFSGLNLPTQCCLEIYISGITSAPPAWVCSESTSSATHQRTPLVADNLPDRNCCDSLVEAFIWNYHPVAPVIHVPTFKQAYEKFWASHVGKQPTSASKILPLIFAVIFAGCVVCSNKTFEAYFWGREQREVASHLHRLARKALQLSHFPRVPTIESLSAYMIVEGTWMREEEPLSTCAFVGVAVRVAQILGLNKDPGCFKSLDPVTAEVRRRLWWHVFHVDVLVAMASGLPPLIDRNSFDVRMVSELGDEHIGTTDGIQYEKDLIMGYREPADGDKGSLVSPLGIFLQGKIQETRKSAVLLFAGQIYYQLRAYVLRTTRGN
jgi:hypothetical protein